MDPVVTVDIDTVTVEPGGQASVTVRVRNLSSIVEGFRLDVLGDASGWAQVLPGRLEVLPQGEAQATVLFAPPSGIATRAGQVPFAVRAVSQVDPASSAVAEGDLHVSGVSLSQAKITPATSRGRWSAKHQLEFSNWGNAPVRLALEVSDPDQALGFLVTPDVLDLPLGTTRMARLKVRARKPFFRGMPVRRAFRVVGRPVEPGGNLPAPGPGPQPYGYDPAQPGVDGAFEQRPIIGRGVLPLAAVALLAAGAVGVLGSRGGGDAPDETVAPPPPQQLTTEPISSDTVRLRWQPGDRVDSYVMYVVDPATKDLFEPTVLDSAEDIPGEQGRYDVEELAPATEHCFQLAAVRGEATSARTPPQCATTAAAPAPGAPAVPSDVTAALQADGTVRITWADNSGGAASHIILRGTTTVVTEVQPPVTEVTVDAVDGDNCFRVRAKQGDLQSDPSDEACAEAAAGGDGGGPVGTGGGAGGALPANLGVIAVPTSMISIVDDPNGAQLAANNLAALSARGVQAGVLVTSDYPGIQPAVPQASYFVYISGFTTADQATAACTGLTLTCATYTPGAPRPGATPLSLPPASATPATSPGTVPP